MSFIEHMRSQGPETWTTHTSIGFDPDLHCSGLAVVTYETSSTGRRKLMTAQLWTIEVHKKYKGLQAAQMMCIAVHQFALLRDNLGGSAIVESQQIYNDPKSTRQKLIGQGNDLLMLATVSGAAAAALHRAGSQVNLMLPAQWKQQKKKEPMQRRAVKLLTSNRIRTFVNSTQWTLDGDAINSAGSHALDALCMALTEAGYNV